MSWDNSVAESRCWSTRVYSLQIESHEGRLYSVLQNHDDPEHYRIPGDRYSTEHGNLPLE